MTPPALSSFRAGDLLIDQSGRRAETEGPVAIVDALTRQVVLGPFRDLAEAVTEGRRLATERGVSLWHQVSDEDGRPLGAMSQLVVRENATRNTVQPL
jgi:hypothetical protein